MQVWAPFLVLLSLTSSTISSNRHNICPCEQQLTTLATGPSGQQQQQHAKCGKLHMLTAVKLSRGWGMIYGRKVHTAASKREDGGEGMVRAQSIQAGGRTRGQGVSMPCSRMMLPQQSLLQVTWQRPSDPGRIPHKVRVIAIVIHV